MKRNGEAEDFREEEAQEKIAQRAYEIYQDRGGQHGRDLDDWLQAEQELMAQAQEQRKGPPSLREAARSPQPQKAGARPPGASERVA
jgi:hypothetical protein